jgi:hypothetical protein
VLEQRIDIRLFRHPWQGGGAGKHGQQRGGNYETKTGTHRAIADPFCRHLLQDHDLHHRTGAARPAAVAAPVPGHYEAPHREEFRANEQISAHATEA